MQDFTFLTKYDCIWVQWCFCYLKQKEIYKFLRRAKKRGLVRSDDENGKTGLIFVKENVGISKRVFNYDENSVYYTVKDYEEFFRKSGFTILRQCY